MANQFLSLALFIMLLSFFIVLNTYVEFDDHRSLPVLESISTAFSTKDVREEVDASLIETQEDKDDSEGSFVDQIEAAFNTQIAGIKIVSQNSFGTTMHMRMPMDKFEQAIKGLGGTQGAENDISFLDTLVSLFQSSEDQLPYRMDMVFNVAKSPAELQNKSQNKIAKNINRISSVAQILEEAGLPRKLMSTALEKGKNGYIDLYFKPYERVSMQGEPG